MNKEIKIELALNAIDYLFNQINDAISNPSERGKLENALAQARLIIESNDPNVFFLKRVMGVGSNITIEELIEVEKLIPLDDFNNDNYEFIGNYTINDDEHEFIKSVNQMCCGIHTSEYVLKSGKKIFFGFDYGH